MSARNDAWSRPSSADEDSEMEMSKAALIEEGGGELAASSRASVFVRDLVELTKPRITVLEVTMMFGGLALAPIRVGMSTIVGAAVGTALVVAGANALNMYIERNSDRLMERTRDRPLPAGRMAPWVALTVAIGCVVSATIALWTLVNPLTAALGLAGFASYAFVYTPLKRYSALALAIGAVPGAIPALMGWTAATGSIGAVGLIYAGTLFFWQIPHFLGIALYRSREYAAASLVVTPNAKGGGKTRIKLVLYTVALVAVSLLLVPTGAAGWLYLVVASVLGAWFLAIVVAGALSDDLAVAGRKIFIASLLYLPVLALGLVVDVVSR